MNFTEAANLVTTAYTILEAIGINPIKLVGEEIGKQTTEYFKKLIKDPSYRGQLAKIISKLIEEYHGEYGTSRIKPGLRFFEFPALWELVLTYQLFEKEPVLKPGDFEGDPNLIQPTQEELDGFAKRLMIAIQDDKELKKRFLDENYQEALYRFAKIVPTKLDELLARPDAITAGFADSIMDAIESEELAAYRPFSALRHLKFLEVSVKRHLNSAKSLQARLYFLMGKASHEVGEASQGDMYFLRAYALQPDIIEYAEQAARSYYNLKQVDKTAEIVEQIKNVDPLNPIASALQLALEPGNELKQKLAELPSMISRDVRFKTIALQLLIHQNTQGEGIDRQLLINDINPYIPNLTQDRNNQRFQIMLATFIISQELTKYSTKFNFDDPLNVIENADLKAAYSLFRQFCDLLRDTEKSPFLTQHFYLLGFVGYLLTGDIEDFAELRLRFRGLKKEERQQYGPNLIYCLFQYGELEEALVFLDQMETSKVPELGFLRVVLLSRLKYPSEEIKAALGQHLNEVENINADNFHRAAYYLEFCELTTERQSFVEQLQLQGKLKQGLATILLQANAIANDASASEEFMHLLAEAKQLLNSGTEEVYHYTLAELYHSAKEFDMAAEVIEAWPGYPNSLNKATERLQLENRYHQRINSTLLIEDLRSWREKYGVELKYCIWEIQIAEMLHDWNQMLELSEIALVLNPASSHLRIAKVKALHMLKCGPELESEIQKVLNDPTGIKRQHLFQIASFASANGHLLMALQMLYPLASNREDKVARNHYFHLNLGKRQELPQFDFKQAQIGSSVKFNIDGIPQVRISVTEQGVKDGINPFAELLLDKEVGKKYNINHPATGRQVLLEIVEITDLYDGLLKEMFEEGQSNDPTLPFEPIAIEGPDIEHLHAALCKYQGAEGVAREIQFRQLFSEYQSGVSTFSTLVSSVFDGNGLQAYHALTGPKQKDVPGLIMPRRNKSERVELTPDTIFILDWTTLPLLYQLWEENNLLPPCKLGISIYAIEFLEEKLL